VLKFHSLVERLMFDFRQRWRFSLPMVEHALNILACSLGSSDLSEEIGKPGRCTFRQL
jgi:hypothetical protein